MTKGASQNWFLMMGKSSLHCEGYTTTAQKEFRANLLLSGHGDRRVKVFAVVNRAMDCVREEATSPM